MSAVFGNIEDAAKIIAKAIEAAASKPTYIVNVIVTPEANSDDLSDKVAEALDRVRARERTFS